MTNSTISIVNNTKIINFYKNSEIYSRISREIDDKFDFSFYNRIKDLYIKYIKDEKNSIIKREMNIHQRFSQKFKELFEKIYKNHFSNNKYLQEDILTKISNFNNNSYLIHHTFIIDNIELNIHIFIYNDRQLNYYTKYINKMILYFKIIKNLTDSSCMKKGCNVYLFLTDAKKKLNINSQKKEILNSSNINSGFCYGCQELGNIVIFREEECMKVFVHELLHAFNIDKNLFNIDNNFLREIYKLNEKVINNMHLNEALIEYYATLIYISIESITYINNYNKKIPNNCIDFYASFKILYKIELVHSMFQVVKILNHYDINYIDLINILDDKTKTSDDNVLDYNEDTHIFSYYILKMLFFYNNLIKNEKVLNNIIKKPRMNDNVYVKILENVVKISNKNKNFLDILFLIKEIIDEKNKTQKSRINNERLLTNLRFTIITY